VNLLLDQVSVHRFYYLDKVYLYVLGESM
jgi:hypothetical protein